jgi:AcrR family transcriptional regulator
MVRYERSGIGDHVGGRQVVAVEGRPARRPRNSLSKEEITAAALEELAASGFAGLTVRAVAVRLGASPMSLYNHVDSRDEIVDLATDAVLGRLDVDTSGKEPLVELAIRHVALLREYPWAIPALLARPYPGLAAARIGEAYLAAAARAGATPAVRASVFLGILALVYGTAGFVVPRAEAQPGEEVVGRVMAVDAGEFPESAAVASELAKYADPGMFADTIRSLLRGLGIGGEA